MNSREQDSPCSRRRFLGSLIAMGAAGVAATAKGFHIGAGERIQLGFDNFSIRAFDYKAPRLIEYASKLNVDTLLLSDLDVYESREAKYLQGLREQARRAEIELQVGTGSICPISATFDHKKWRSAEEHARALIQTANGLGSSVARCYLGNRNDRGGDGGIERRIEETVKVLQSVKQEAEDAGMHFAVENHAGDMQAWELVQLIEAAGSSFVGATMDAGNAVWALEDPMVNLEILAPYALTTGIRDSAVWESAGGATSMWTNMGQGCVDWPAYVDRFQELCPNTPFVLEIISYRWPSEAAYLTPEFWSNYPKARANEFAKFVALAKRGEKARVPAARPSGDDSKELEQAQQQFDLEQSLAYCRDVLGLGRK